MTLREWLFRKEMTIADFARRCEVSYGYMRTIVKGRNTPGKYLKKKIDELTNGEVQ